MSKIGRLNEILEIVGGKRTSDGAYAVSNKMSSLFQKLTKEYFDEIREKELKEFYRILKK